MPLSEPEELEELPSAETLNAWVKAVAALGPEVEWLATEDNDLILGEDATMTTTKDRVKGNSSKKDKNNRPLPKLNLAADPAVGAWVEETANKPAKQIPSTSQQRDTADEVTG